MLGLLIGVDLKDLSNAVVVIPLLKKLLFICRGISLYKILQLRQVCSEQDTPSHQVDGAQMKNGFRTLLDSTPLNMVKISSHVMGIHKIIAGVKVHYMASAAAESAFSSGGGSSPRPLPLPRDVEGPPLPPPRPRLG